MSERSILRVRERPHIHPDRRNEQIWEVVRDGEVVAHIYGTRDGVQVVSPRLDRDGRNKPYLFEASGVSPGWVIPLLAPDDPCPLCVGGVFLGVLPCPICRGTK